MYVMSDGWQLKHRTFLLTGFPEGPRGPGSPLSPLGPAGPGKPVIKTKSIVT